MAIESETDLLFDITMLLIVAGVCSILFRRIRLPAIIGYLMAGVLLGPYVFPQYVVDQDIVSIFSSMGIVLLMFYIGLELNLRGLRKVASYALIIVTIEMFLMVGVGYALGTMLGLGTSASMLIGVTISCASTAVVIGTMKDNEHMQNRLSRAVVGVMVMEDIGLIIILALSDPIINGTGTSIVDTLLLIITFIGATVVIGLTCMPRLLDWVDRNYSGETLFLVAAGFGFGLAYISSTLGLSVAIGAFLAGILISQANCCRTVLSKVEPMKEMFMAIFFISIGFELDPSLMIDGLPLAILIAAVFITAKLLSVGMGCMAANFKARSSFLIATSMVAMGEFTFVVAKIGLSDNIISDSLYSSIVGAALITMLLLPFISRSAPKNFEWLAARLPKKAYENIYRIETGRQQARAGMERSDAVRKEVRKQLMLVLVDYIIIVIILLVMNFASSIGDYVARGLGNDTDLSSLILFIVSIFLIAAPIAHMVKRIRIISATVAGTISAGSGEDRLEKRADTYKFITKFGSMLSFLLIIAIVFPLLPQVKGLPVSPVGIALGVIILVWFAWGTVNTTYDKISGAFIKTIAEMEADADNDEDEAP